MTPAAVLLRRTLGPILLAALAAGVVVAAVTRQQAPGVEATLAFTVPAPTRGNTSPMGANETAFESLQAAELFAETLSGWLNSPDVVAAVYRRAGVAFQGPETVRRLGRAFVAKKRGGQVVDVSFRARSSEEAAAIARAIADEVSERTRALNAGGGGWSFRPVTGTPLVVPVRVSPALRGLTGAVVVGVLGVNLVLLWDFFRSGTDNARGQPEQGRT